MNFLKVLNFALKVVNSVSDEKNSWESLSILYDGFVRIASKLAFLWLNI